VVLCCRVLRSSPKTVGVGAERATG
jgi:hypothetical protein